MYIIIVGCGKIGSYLANLLQDDHNVVVIDREAANLSKVGDNFNGFSIVGDALDMDVLKEAGIEKADAVAVTTSNDNTNIVIAQISKKVFNVPKVVARVSDIGKAEVYRNLGVDPVNSTSIFATLLREKIIERNFTTYMFESNKVSLLEIKDTGGYSGKTVKELNMPGEFQVVTVVRGQEPVIPEEKTAFEKGDIIVGVVKLSSLKKVKKVLKIS
ncbi:MAG: TrkA family potassium uptake protein [Candidatus Omnitrophica bacterium]|nr:TrkA family potassium uptake protein [Candidatus Omnitrophota bacterium]